MAGLDRSHSPLPTPHSLLPGAGWGGGAVQNCPKPAPEPRHHVFPVQHLGVVDDGFAAIRAIDVRQPPLKTLSLVNDSREGLKMSKINQPEGLPQFYVKRGASDFDVASDDQHFLMMTFALTNWGGELVMVQNWFEEFRGKVGRE